MRTGTDTKLKLVRGGIRNKVPRSKVIDYDVVIASARPLLPSEEPHEYLFELKGSIWTTDEGGKRIVSVGTIDACIFQATRADSAGFSVVDVADSEQALLDMHCALYDSVNDPSDLRELVSDGCAGMDVLFIRSVQIDSAHRGLRLGQLAVLRLIEDFGSSCGVVVLQPAPLRHEPVDEAAWDRGVLRLRSYWREIGFEPVAPFAAKERKNVEHSGFDPTVYSVLDLQRHQASFETLIQSEES